MLQANIRWPQEVLGQKALNYDKQKWRFSESLQCL